MIKPALKMVVLHSNIRCNGHRQKLALRLLRRIRKMQHLVIIIAPFIKNQMDIIQYSE